MGILNTLSKNPTLIALGALAVGLFIFRDRISGFFSDITGGLEGAKELGETTRLLNENLLGNLKGIQDLLSGEFFKDFKLPEFTFPEFKFPDINIDLPDFTSIFAGFQEQIDKGLAGIVPQVEPERMDVPFPIEDEPDKIIDIVPDFGLRDDPRRTKPEPEPTIIFRDAERFARDFPESFTPIEIPFAVANVEETQAGFQERAGAFVEALPEVTAFTSLPDSRTDFVRRQLSRNQEDFESILEAEARRSETIFAGLFGNVQNPNF